MRAKTFMETLFRTDSVQSSTTQSLTSSIADATVGTTFVLGRLGSYSAGRKGRPRARPGGRENWVVHADSSTHRPTSPSQCWLRCAKKSIRVSRSAGKVGSLCDSYRALEADDAHRDADLRRRLAADGWAGRAALGALLAAAVLALRADGAAGAAGRLLDALARASIPEEVALPQRQS